MRALAVEDDPRIRRDVTAALAAAGFRVEVAETGEEAWFLGDTEDYDLVILDLGLPTLDGLEVCRRVRATGSAVPVLILTARADEVDTVVGLDAGADDYVTKPFRLAELMARVRALLRRSAPEDPASGSPIRIDTKARRAWFHGDELALTVKEFEVLSVLVREAGRVVPRARLMAEVWETEWYGSTKTLDMHVSVLRRKLGDEASNPRYITTVRGVGFRFDAC